jgi:hypothetical protein
LVALLRVYASQHPEEREHLAVVAGRHGRRRCLEALAPWAPCLSLRCSSGKAVSCARALLETRFEHGALDAHWNSALHLCATPQAATSLLATGRFDVAGRNTRGLTPPMCAINRRRFSTALALAPAAAATGGEEAAALLRHAARSCCSDAQVAVLAQELRLSPFALLPLPRRRRVLRRAVVLRNGRCAPLIPLAAALQCRHMIQNQRSPLPEDAWRLILSFVPTRWLALLGPPPPASTRSRSTTRQAGCLGSPPPRAAPDC